MIINMYVNLYFEKIRTPKKSKKISKKPVKLDGKVLDVWLN